MKNYIRLAAVALFTIIISAFSIIKSTKNMNSGKANKVPSVNIKTLDGKTINSKGIFKKGEPTLLVFWATCCAPCKKELTAISKVYDTWKEETGINIVAVSVDLPQYVNGVKPFVINNNWDFDVYLDVDRNLMHGMNAYSTPHSYLINAKGEIIWEKQGFIQGDEEKIYTKINSFFNK